MQPEGSSLLLCGLVGPTLEEAGICWREQGTCNSCTPASSLHSESILARGITSWCPCCCKSLIFKAVKAKASHLDEVLVPCQHFSTRLLRERKRQFLIT